MDTSILTYFVHLCHLLRICCISGCNRCGSSIMVIFYWI